MMVFILWLRYYAVCDKDREIFTGNLMTEVRIQCFAFSYLLRAENIGGAVDSRTGKVYIVIKQTAGPTDILLCCWC